MNETTLERDVRLRNEGEVQKMADRIMQLELWQTGHEAICAGRYRLLIMVGLLAIGLQAPTFGTWLLALLK